MNMNIVKKYHLKTIIPVIGFCLIFVSLIMIFSNDSHIVGKYDDVKIEYTVWVSNEDEDYNPLNPILDTTIWVIMIPITDDSTSGLILGLYNNLIKKELYFESELIWLNRCIDQDRDGIDDFTGNLALTYGNSSDLYFDTCLMIQFKVLDILKGSGTPIDWSWSGFNQFFQILSDKFLFNINIMFPVLLLSSTILLTFMVDFISRHPIKIEMRAVLRGVFKYGLMIGVVYAIPYIIFGMVNLTLTPEELSLLKIRYNFFTPLIIFF
ncbi:unnamed protein product, partial [marine sediment metagenome]